MKKYIVVLLIMLSIGSVAFGSPADIIPDVKFTEDLDFNEVKLSDALALMSRSIDITMVADSDVKDQPIDLYITKGQRLKEVLDIIKVTNDLEEMYIGKSLIFTKKGTGPTAFMGKVLNRNNEGIEGVRVQLGEGQYKSVRTVQGGLFVFDKIVPGAYMVKIEKDGYTPSSEVVDVKQNEVTNLNMALFRKNEEGTMKVEKEEDQSAESLGSNILGDGKAVTTKRIQLKHAFAEDVEKVVTATFGSDITITSFPKLHILIIQGEALSVDTAEKLIEDLDRPIKQVRITAQILDTSDNLLENLGFNWLFSNNKTDIADAGPKEGGSLKIFPATIMSFVDIFNDGKNMFSLSVSMLKTTGDLLVSSVPSTVIVNGEEAYFEVSRENVVGTEVKENGSSGNTTTSDIRQTAGTMFTVTPTVRDGEDGTDVITLEIKSEVSTNKKDENDETEFLKNLITTKVQVRDGEVIFIGGLKKTQTIQTINKVPILGDIPFLGTLFTKRNTINNVRQIYIQITAEIVTDGNKRNKIDTDQFKNSSIPEIEVRKIYKDFKKESDNDGKEFVD
ncbi:MAG: carboxypeptidase regulatory-like domain-containing protein [Psychrilyobacter sp.]|nr:carboxypeptidase regulatory-like domain-containing protein [Psychrilyobacter sp.]